ncbi:MAG: tRNA (adenosine(37)-N6)-threonylcarbamoyltransferase complex dimerization subunit type 1 TsaB [Synechococcaceae cyanobacterium SM2_3_1]|nr:tRNA (adenosine(37)-N6)-threonylcarbamoyltransferase complex dimerization subunit type 1 TsaB [Synechococcaceae cyanobacterium SM2_3_1]
MSKPMQGWLLGIHTTTPTLGLAMQPVSGSQMKRSQTWSLGRQMAQQLHPRLENFLPPQQWSDLVGIGVAVGPGSFTGSRLGVTVARTLGQGLCLPVYGVSSLAALAYARIETDPVSLLAVQLDAQRGDWYGAVYRYAQATDQLSVVVPEQLWSTSSWQAQLHLLQAQPCSLEIVDGTALADPPVQAVATLAYKAYASGQLSTWSDILPQYLRQPPIDSGALKAPSPPKPPAD